MLTNILLHFSVIIHEQEIHKLSQLITILSIALITIIALLIINLIKINRLKNKVKDLNNQ